MADTQNQIPYKKILIKLSGEVLKGDRSCGIDGQVVARLAKEIKDIHSLGISICIVVGGGNIFRGSRNELIGIDRVTADHMGMLGTVINGLALESAIKSLGIEAQMYSAIDVMSVAELYTVHRARMALNNGKVLIFTAGTGNPFFTTDTAATLRASEMGCDVLLKGTKVSGVYTDDPEKNPEAERYTTIHYHDVINQNLKVMDTAAIALAAENKIPIIVFNILKEGELYRALTGQGQTTLVSS